MAVALSSNCSLSAGRTQLVHVKSTPSGAKVSLNGDSVGETPVHVRVQRRDADAVLHIEEVGFESVERRLDRRLGGWFWGDFATALVLGSIAGLGAALDDGGFGPASIGFGALWSTAVLAPPLALGTVYEFPNEVDVFLQRINGTVDPTATKFRIPVRQSIGMRSDSSRIREWLVKGKENAERTRLRKRIRAVRDGGRWSGRSWCRRQEDADDGRFIACLGGCVRRNVPLPAGRVDTSGGSSGGNRYVYREPATAP